MIDMIEIATVVSSLGVSFAMGYAQRADVGVAKFAALIWAWPWFAAAALGRWAGAACS